MCNGRDLKQFQSKGGETNEREEKEKKKKIRQGPRGKKKNKLHGWRY